MSNIGLLNEKPLHASLKEWYALPGDQFEVSVDGYVIDIVRDGLLIEIQTGNFTSIKSKLKKLLTDKKVKLVYPIPKEKWIVKLPKDGTNNVRRRKSPRRGQVEDIFFEMVSLPHFINHGNFSLEILMIKEEEVRRLDGSRNWRRKGWVTEEHRLIEVVDTLIFEKPADWRALIPEDLDLFTAKDLTETLNISTPLSQKMAYCLRKAGIIRLNGKQGRANLYSLVN